MKTPPVIFLPLSEPKGNGRLNRFITYFTSKEVICCEKINSSYCSGSHRCGCSGGGFLRKLTF